MQPFPRALLDLTERQFGVVGRHQLTNWFTPGVVDGLVRRGVLVAVERGVYRMAGGAITPQQPPMAAVLRARPQAAATGPRVLAMLGIDGCRLDDPFEILTAPGRRLRGATFTHRHNPTVEEPTVMIGGLRAAQPTVALVDSGRYVRTLGERRLRLAYDATRWRGLTDAARVLRRARMLGRADPGAAVFLRWDDHGDLVPESTGERRVWWALTGFEPAPEPQVRILTYRIDWYWRTFRLGIEYFGDVDHGFAEARLADTERARTLADAGVRLLPVVARDLDDRDAFRAWVRSQLTVRAVSLGIRPPS